MRTQETDTFVLINESGDLLVIAFQDPEVAREYAEMLLEGE